MSGELCLICGRIIPFDEERFVHLHLRCVEPAVGRVVFDAVDLPGSIAVDQIGGDKVRKGDVVASQTASGASRSGPRIGRHTLTISKRWLSSSPASSPIRSRTRCGPESIV